MAGINQFKPFAVSPEAALVLQSVWESALLRPIGNVPGSIANSGLVNKALRQGTMGTAAIGEFVIHNSNVDAIDDGNPENLALAFSSAMTGFIANSLFNLLGTDNLRALIEDILREILPFSLNPQLSETSVLGFMPGAGWIWIPLSQLGAEGGGGIGFNVINGGNAQTDDTEAIDGGDPETDDSDIIDSGSISGVM